MRHWRSRTAPRPAPPLGVAALALTALAFGCGGGGGARPDAAASEGRDAARPADASAYEGAWARAADVGGGPVQEFGAAALSGRLYVVGGMLDTFEVLDRVKVYDPSEDLWDDAPALPRSAHHPNTVAVGGALYVVGSLGGTSFSERGAVWRYTPGENAWAQVSEMPSPRGASAVAVADGWIYIAGGYDGSSAVTTVSAYHPGDDVWNTDLPPLPDPRDHFVGAAIDGVVYVVGGRDTRIDALTARVDAFDPAEGAWQPRADMITARAGGAGGVVNGEIIVVGGEGNPASGSRGVFAQAEAYDPASDTWRALPDLPTPRHGMQGAGIGGALHVPGGAEARGLSATTAVHEVLTP